MGVLRKKVSDLLDSITEQDCNSQDSYSIWAFPENEKWVHVPLSAPNGKYLWHYLPSNHLNTTLCDQEKSKFLSQEFLRIYKRSSWLLLSYHYQSTLAYPDLISLSLVCPVWMPASPFIPTTQLTPAIECDQTLLSIWEQLEGSYPWKGRYKTCCHVPIAHWHSLVKGILTTVLCSTQLHCPPL